MQEYRDVADSEREVGNRREREQIGGTCVVLKLPVARTFVQTSIMRMFYLYGFVWQQMTNKNLVCLY